MVDKNAKMHKNVENAHEKLFIRKDALKLRWKIPDFS